MENLGTITTRRALKNAPPLGSVQLLCCLAVQLAITTLWSGQGALGVASIRILCWRATHQPRLRSGVLRHPGLRCD